MPLHSLRAALVIQAQEEATAAAAAAEARHAEQQRAAAAAAAHQQMLQRVGSGGAVGPSGRGAEAAAAAEGPLTGLEEEKRRQLLRTVGCICSGAPQYVLHHHAWMGCMHCGWWRLDAQFTRLLRPLRALCCLQTEIMRATLLCDCPFPFMHVHRWRLRSCC